MTLLERLYRLLLCLYPRSYRREYADPMATHFRDLLRDAQERGALAVLWLWTRLLLDLVTTAPREHLEAAMTATVPPLPWRKVLLAALPGTGLLVVSLLRVHVLPAAQVGLVYQAYRGALILTLAGFVVGGFVVERRLAVWALPALGYAVPQLLLNLWGVGVFRILYPALSVALIPALGVLIWHTRRRGRAAAWAWPLPGLAFALGLLGEIWLNPTVLQQPVPALMAQILGIALLLVFVALGLPLAWRYGSLAGLFLVATLFLIASYRLDPTYGLWGSPWSTVVGSMQEFSFLIAAPLLALRARSERGRIVAMLAVSAAGLFAAALVGPLVRGWVDWHRLLGAVQLMLTLAFALVLYANASKNAALTPAEGQTPSPEAA